MGHFPAASFPVKCRKSRKKIRKRTVNWPLIYKMYGHFPVNSRFLVLFLSQLGLPITEFVKLPVRLVFTVNPYPLIWSVPSRSHVQHVPGGGGGTRMARGGIRLVHGHTKSTLITYFSGMKIDPKYAFLQAFFLICPSCPFQNLSIWPKTHPFFQFCTFLHP